MLIGPRYKICRRLGTGVFEKCQTQKFAVSEAKKRTKRRRRSRTNFALQLLEKQKTRFTYGLSERQFGRYVKESIRRQTGEHNPQENLYERLEFRLDNVIFRAGFARSRRMARQLVSHGHILVNERKVTIPSFKVSVDDVVTVREKSKDSAVFADVREGTDVPSAPNWLTVDNKALSLKVVAIPQFTPSDQIFDLTRVIEFYSR